MPPQRKPKRDAFVWCRQFSRDRLEQLGDIRCARKWWLDEETAKLSAFSRLQIGRTYNWCGGSIDGVWEGREVEFGVTIRPLFIRYAVDVFRQALRDTLDHYPNFTRVEFEDGPLAGERRIIFPDRLDEAATTWLYNRFLEIAEKGDVRVQEGFSAKFVDDPVRIRNRVKVSLEIEIDRSEMNQGTWHEFQAILSAGKLPEVDAKPRRCDSMLSAAMLKHISLPELFVLNWKDCLPLLGDADHSLFEACGKLDVNGIRAALSSGANPNSIDGEKEETPLGLLVEQTERCRHEEGYSQAVADEKERVALHAIDLLIQAGAAVDLAAFNEDTPLAAACLYSDAGIITRLLEHGADPSIHCNDDDPKGDLGTAWDHAYFRSDHDVDNDDPSAWDALRSFYPPPFQDVHLPDPSNAGP